ncbi:FMN-binding protein [Celerinatantimonas diazotrophica]|uniref:Na+-transporting NADH:ubiquinone oxidoreductase subunit C n=1 Tax=Celerinatantimonas diazotrophica TaxID=412034 RepID=A0A4R1J9P3_9GAMM|nr:FMN-binding protein [Celerinatantimonas diazotrophica]TCK47335.1 Na+-transporting NADH:ubiquinone oxidoreductase subunit C [Celerinatantimonas diazotrophica]CAG9295049.1 Na(+)-translocating NADH-quinone reductase subunit C [Celerinatantimonas diazotrophica]
MKLSQCAWLILAIVLLSGCFSHSGSSSADLDKTIHTSLYPTGKYKIKREDPQRVLLEVAGLAEQQQTAKALIKTDLVAVVVDFKQHRLIQQPQVVARFDPSKVAYTQLDPKQNLAHLPKRPEQIRIYLKHGNRHQPAEVIVPVQGMGYFSMLYGYAAFNLHTLRLERIGFYQQAETPALGGQIMTNKKWLNQFSGKQVLNNGQPVFKVAPRHGHASIHSFDAISGATHTSKGVANLLNYWCGPAGYGPFFAKLSSQAS